MLVNIFIQIILILYLIMTIMILPLYFHGTAGYSHIATDKIIFYIKSGGLLAVFSTLSLMIYYAVWMKKKVKDKYYAELDKNDYLIQRTDVILKYLNRDVLKEMYSKHITVIFAVCYTFAIILSYFFSNYKEAVLYGTKGWYMGFVFQMIVLIFFFILAGSARKWKEEILGIPIIMMLVVSTVVFILGILNRYGINPLHLENKGPQFISTIGNINWYCGYWSVVFPIGLALFCTLKKNTKKFMQGKEVDEETTFEGVTKNNVEDIVLYWIKKSLLAVYIVIGYMAGITQGSDTGIVVICMILIMLGFVSIRKKEYAENFLEVIMMLCIILKILALIQYLYPEKNTYASEIFLWLIGTDIVWLVLVVAGIVYGVLKTAKGSRHFPIYVKGWRILSGILFLLLVGAILLVIFNTIYPGKIPQLNENTIFTFNNAWGNARGGTWTIGIWTWLSQNNLHKLFGVGPDGMEAYLYSGMNEELLQYTRNIFGDVRLTNAHGEWITLLVNTGLFGTLSFIGMVVTAIWRFLKSKNAIAIACGMSIFAYTIHNLFSFQQIMNVTHFFVVLAIGECVIRKGCSTNKTISCQMKCSEK